MLEDTNANLAPPATGLRAGNVTRHPVRKLILQLCLVVTLAFVTLYGCAFLMFLPSALARSSDVRDYPRFRSSIQDLHGWYARMLPPSIPTVATNSRMLASLDDMMQAEPFLFLAIQLPPTDSQAELSRLRSLHPRAEHAGSAWPRLLADLNLAAPNAVTFEFAPEHTSDMLSATVWHDPATGWFHYELTSD